MALFMASRIIQATDSGHHRKDDELPVPTNPQSNRQAVIRGNIDSARTYFRNPIVCAQLLSRGGGRKTDSADLSVQDPIVSWLQLAESDSIAHSIEILNEQRERLNKGEKDRMIFIQKETQKNLTVATGLLHKLPPLLDLVESLESDLKNLQSSAIDPHAKEVSVAKFLASVMEAARATSRLNSMAPTEYVQRLDEILDSQRLIEGTIFEITKSGHTNSSSILRSRYKIVLKKVNRYLEKTYLSGDSEEHKNAEITKVYQFLSQFSNTASPLYLESTLLAPELRRFKYHFAREGSALNVVEHPEWPLRRMIEIGKDVREKYPDGVMKFLVCLANATRTYYRDHRWNQITDLSDPEQSDLFSFYLNAYVVSVSHWISEFGNNKNMLDALMSDIIENEMVEGTQWRLLDAWINYDKAYFDTTLSAVENPTDPSKFNPTLCNIAQVLLDLFETSSNRLLVLRTNYPLVFEYFVEECHDIVVREHIFHLFRRRNSLAPATIELAKASLAQILSLAKSRGLVSNSVQIHLSDMIKQIE